MFILNASLNTYSAEGTKFRIYNIECLMSGIHLIGDMKDVPFRVALTSCCNLDRQDCVM